MEYEGKRKEVGFDEVYDNMPPLRTIDIKEAFKIFLDELGWGAKLTYFDKKTCNFILETKVLSKIDSTYFYPKNEEEKEFSKMLIFIMSKTFSEDNKIKEEYSKEVEKMLINKDGKMSALFATTITPFLAGKVYKKEFMSELNKFQEEIEDSIKYEAERKEWVGEIKAHKHWKEVIKKCDEMKIFLKDLYGIEATFKEDLTPLKKIYATYEQMPALSLSFDYKSPNEDFDRCEIMFALICDKPKPGDPDESEWCGKNEYIFDERFVSIIVESHIYLLKDKNSLKISYSDTITDFDKSNVESKTYEETVVIPLKKELSI